MKLKVQPTCRYGHGELQQATSFDVADESSTWFALLPTHHSGRVALDASFVVQLYECKTCTYMEIHDVPQEEFQETVFRTLLAEQEAKNGNKP